MSMVEKTARAICVALGDFPDAELTYEGRPIGPAWKRYDDAARAALEALRVPSEEMVEAVVPEPTHLYGKDGRDADYERQMKAAVMVDRLVAKQRYEAMLTAALGETE